MAWRCDSCNEREDKDGYCLCERNRQRLARLEEVERELAEARAEVKKLEMIRGNYAFDQLVFKSKLAMAEAELKSLRTVAHEAMDKLLGNNHSLGAAIDAWRERWQSICECPDPIVGDGTDGIRRCVVCTRPFHLRKVAT